MKTGRIIKVSGPLVVAEGMLGTKMYDVVYVGEMKLLGEVIELKEDKAYIQVYEDTHGLGPGDPVFGSGSPLVVELGPGLIESFFDGVQRPLDKIKILAGDFISRGIHVPGLPRDKKWFFIPKVKVGDEVKEGDIIGEVNETSLVKHKILVPPGLNGVIIEIREGSFTVEDTIAILKDPSGKEHHLTMMQKWPVRIPRPYKEKLLPESPMFTGQRVIDTFFPIAKGGTACVPGPFGSGKTVIQ
ncbi:MAG: V-type ATP synthase subunit A, partial [candidate division WOR-3 bacterium]